MVPPLGQSIGNKMDYEQYLYGPATRDAADRASPGRHIGRIGSLAVVVVGAVAVLSIAIGLLGAGEADHRSAAGVLSAGPTAGLPPKPLTLAVSEDPARASRP